MNTIEFTFDTFDGRELEIIAEMNADQIWFKAFENGQKIPNASLTTIDFKNIEAFVINNSQEDDLYESDFYDRQSD